MTETFEQGWAARPFKEQFPELTESAAEYLDRVNYSIIMMLVSDMITDSQAENIRTKRFPRLVSEKVLEARGKEEDSP